MAFAISSATLAEGSTIPKQTRAWGIRPEGTVGKAIFTRIDRGRTGICLAGLVERRHKAILGMGIDSLIVLVAYIGGLVVLFSLR
jgi:hypothetical protein